MIGLIGRRTILTKNIRNFRYFNYSNVLKKEILPNDEWIKRETNGIKFGITENAIIQMGELVYLEFNNSPDDYIKKDEELVIIESVKSVQILGAPFDCRIIDNNLNLEESLESINSNPECEDNSWLVKIEEK